ncbi:MAG: aminomethyl-transferring glycine dehydrogenase subunit GcvPA [bacterium]
MDYIPLSEEDIKFILDTLGLEDIDSLFSDIPKEIKLQRVMNLPSGIKEIELVKVIEDLSRMNKTTSNYLWFVGGGCYRHFIPQALNEVSHRQEFYTSYTPYQPELSQGTLQALFEYQSMLCSLLQMEVTNDSIYDGATATVEAMFMASDITKRRKVLVARSLHPEYRTILNTYAISKDIVIEEVPFDHSTGRIEMNILGEKIKDASCFIFQTPNFFGVVEDVMVLKEIVHREGALLVPVIVEPLSLAILKPPGEYEADITSGDLQSFGLGMRFGGPTVGFLATKKAYIRRLPGRIVGLTNDSEGKPAYAFVLQTREQHIRRASATSNICSNEALCAIKVAIYLSLMGEENLKSLAWRNYNLALIAHNELGSYFDAPFFNEFLVRVKDFAPKVKNLLRRKGIMILDPSRWYPELQDAVLLTFTEMNTASEVELLVEEIRSYV